MVFSLGFWVGAGCGGAVIWFFKDQVLKMVVGAEAFVAMLEAKIKAIKGG